VKLQNPSLHCKKAVEEHFTLDLHRTALFLLLVGSFSRFNENLRLHFMLRLSIFIKVGGRNKPNYSGAGSTCCMQGEVLHTSHTLFD
jgi:hypothetical protein